MDLVFNAILWKIYNIYVGADCSKILTMIIVRKSDVKNIISVSNNIIISEYLSKLQVHMWTSAVNGLLHLTAINNHLNLKRERAYKCFKLRSLTHKVTF